MGLFLVVSPRQLTEEAEYLFPRHLWWETCWSCEKHTATDVAVDVLGEEWKGHGVRISDGNNRQGSSMKQGVLTMAECVCCWLRGVLTDQGELEKGRASLFMFALGTAIWMLSTSVVIIILKRGVVEWAEYSCLEKYYCASEVAAQREPVSRDVCQYIKEGIKAPSTNQDTWDSVPCYSTCPTAQTSIDCSGPTAHQEQ